jgi:oligopeptide transport system permease protein
MPPIVVVFVAIGLVSWLTMARITRGQVLSLKEREFVVAARAIGAKPLRIIFRHIVPNLLGPVIVYSTLTVPEIMLSEAFLSFVGLGISEPNCSWGSLASEGLTGINIIKPFWWLMAYPASALSITLFCLNFIGDGLRDALDPKSAP